MEDSPTGSPTQEEQPAIVSPAVTTTVEAVPQAPAGGKQPARHNWTLIALVAVSIVAVLLLASTITLAVVGDFGGHDRPGTPARIGDQPMGPMQQGPGTGRRQGRPEMPGAPGQNLQNQGDQGSQGTQQPPSTPESRSR